MRLTLIHPAMGRKPGSNYIRSWQMESLPVAALAGLTPKDVAISFFDDRLETGGLRQARGSCRNSG